MSKEYFIQVVSERILGNICYAEEANEALRKWRKIFDVSQTELAQAMGISPTVIVDYERGRRVPGLKFLRRYVNALIRIDESRGFPIVKELMKTFSVNLNYIIDMGDFYPPISFSELIIALDGIPVNSFVPDEKFFGYIIADSIKSITTLSGNEFYQFLGYTVGRILIFTKVTSGRSPLVAAKVAPIKPKAIALHSPLKLDYLALYLSEIESIPVIVSTLRNEQQIINRLSELKKRNHKMLAPF
ncbi:transcriptional regulator [Sulfolobales archaeon HS-7]|nr:transcriptional regulator [Sulfolobales archaeon HS-7]